MPPRSTAKPDSRCDVLVIGGGPAGATAAVFLAREQRSVALVERNRIPASAGPPCWVNARIEPMLAELGIDFKGLTLSKIQSVTFHSSDFTKSVTPRFDTSPGFLMDRSRLNKVLIDSARSSGAQIVSGSDVTHLVIRETDVGATLDGGKSVAGRLMLLACGADSPLPARAGFLMQNTGFPIWTAQVQASRSTGKSAATDSQVGIVLGLNRSGSFGFYCVTAGTVFVTVNWIGERSQASVVLDQLCAGLFERRLIPVDLRGEVAGARVVRCPASAALDADTHVGKNTLLIGDAGGFVSASSNEGIYPAMWSAQIAASVMVRALDSTSSQDVLISFNTEWRTKMADYLRPPNTDPQFLLPLVFTNQPMADRMGAAFFSGENI